MSIKINIQKGGGATLNPIDNHKSKRKEILKECVSILYLLHKMNGLFPVREILISCICHFSI